LPNEAVAPALTRLSRLVGRHAFFAEEDSLRTERTLAGVRALFASVSLIAIYLDSTAHYASLAYGLLTAYVVYSVGVVVLVVRFRSRVSQRFSVAVHGVDVLAAAVLTLFTEGPTSPFFVFFGFVLLAAAYRWGLWEAVATSLVSVVMFGVEAILMSAPAELSVFEGQFELNRFIIRCTYLMLLAVMVGYVAEEEKAGRAESTVLANTLARAQSAGTFSAALSIIANEMLRLFGARALCFLVEELSSGRLFLWDASRAAGSQETVLGMRELDAAQRDVYTVPIPAADCMIVRRGPSSHCELLVPKGVGRRLTQLPVRPSTAFLATRSFHRAFTVSQSFGEDWQTRLFLFDPATPHARVRTLHLLGTLTRHLGPAAYSAYLVGRLRSRVSAVERARLARELHDGAIQSLLGLGLQLDVVRRHQPRGSKPRADLVRIQKLLHGEVLKLRMLTFRLAPATGHASDLPGALEDLIERFERDSDISARFVSELGDIEAPPPRTCREIARIVQEALVNIQKHSEARQVLVRLSAQDGCWTLVVDDDGRGFDFAGKLSHDELDRTRRGPRTIKERVRLLNGALAIDSTPGTGARLEITIPQQRGVARSN